MSPQMTRRHFLNTLATAGAALALAACAPKAPTALPTAMPAPKQEKPAAPAATAAPKAAAPTAAPVAADKAVTIRYQNWWGAYNATAFPSFLKDFKDKYPNITVELEEVADRVQVFQTCYVAGTCADVTYHDNFFSKFYDEGLILQLDDYFSRDAIDFENDFYHGLALEKWKGKLYGFPHMYESCVMFYNVDMVKKYWGKDLWEAFPDGNWDVNDLVEIAQACTVDTDGDGKIDQWGLWVNHRDYYYGMEWYSWTAGDSIFDLDNVKYNFTKDIPKQAAHWCLDGVKGPKPWMISVEDYNEVNKALAVTYPFIAGKNAFHLRMCTDAGRIIGSVGPGDGSKGFKWDIFHLPNINGNQAVTRAGGHPNCISKTGKEYDASWSFIKEMGTTMGQKYVGDTKMSIPIYRKDTALRDTLVVGKPAHDSVILDVLEKKGGYGDHMRFHTEAECRAIMTKALDLIYAMPYEEAKKELDATLTTIESEMNAAVDYGGGDNPFLGQKLPMKPGDVMK